MTKRKDRFRSAAKNLSQGAKSAGEGGCSGSQSHQRHRRPGD